MTQNPNFAAVSEAVGQISHPSLSCSDFPRTLSWPLSWSLRTAATRALSVAGSTRGGGFLRPRLGNILFVAIR
jgi:hypothetical protein